jgi:hypothetical protein
MEQFLLNLSNHQVQDILEELGMLENGNCPYTAEEIFKAGMEYAINKGLLRLDDNKVMTQEENELLLKDVCARLPYEIILLSANGKVTYQTDGNTAIELLIEEGWKPYLRPMSSMSEEEEKEYRNIDNRSYSCPMEYAHIPASERIDWLNKNHFDYRGLIEKGLALEAPKGMYN